MPERDSPLNFPIVTQRQVLAVKAWSEGKATPEDQETSYKVVISLICAKDRLTFFPGEDRRRESDLAEGMRRVAYLIEMYATKPMEKLFPELKKRRLHE